MNVLIMGLPYALAKRVLDRFEILGAMLNIFFAIKWKLLACVKVIFLWFGTEKTEITIINILNKAFIFI